MKTSVKNISDTRVEVTITLNEKELATAEKVAITKLAKEKKLDPVIGRKQEIEREKRESKARENVRQTRSRDEGPEL